MNAAAEYLFEDGETANGIIDKTGRSDGRAIIDDATHSDLDGELIGATAAHAARIGHHDADVLVELLNKDRHDMVLAGMPSDTHPGQTRKFVIDDVLRVLKTPRYRALAREARDKAAAEAKRQARHEREEREAAAKAKAAFEGQVALIPDVYQQLVDRIEQLEAHVGLYTRASGARSRALD